MSYIDSNLLAGESVIYKAKLHWIIFLKAFILIIIGLFLTTIDSKIGGIIFTLGILIGLPAFIDLKTSEFGVTNKRVIIKVGFIRRRTLELLLQQVEAISVDQSVLGRILRFGTITLSGTGGVREIFPFIEAPLEFRHQIQGQII